MDVVLGWRGIWLFHQRGVLTVHNSCFLDDTHSEHGSMLPATS
jgi:hypothetical protein